MPGFDGTGPRGMGSMTGGGRGYCVPTEAGFNFQRTVVHRGISNIYPYARNFNFQRVTQSPSGIEELGFLKNQARLLGDQLKSLEIRIQELEAHK